MAEINIVEASANAFEVTVVAQSTSVPLVSLQPEYAQKLTAGKSSSAELVRKSFEFLLAREPNTSILRSFDLSVIGRYFPEYEREINILLTDL